MAQVTKEGEIVLLHGRKEAELQTNRKFGFEYGILGRRF
jgi:hypothetical protein